MRRRNVSRRNFLQNEKNDERMKKAEKKCQKRWDIRRHGFFSRPFEILFKPSLHSNSMWLHSVEQWKWMKAPRNRKEAKPNRTTIQKTMQSRSFSFISIFSLIFVASAKSESIKNRVEKQEKTDRKNDKSKRRKATKVEQVLSKDPLQRHLNFRAEKIFKFVHRAFAQMQMQNVTLVFSWHSMPSTLSGYSSSLLVIS